MISLCIFIPGNNFFKITAPENNFIIHHLYDSHYYTSFIVKLTRMKYV